jgi:hypothetical protein
MYTPQGRLNAADVAGILFPPVPPPAKVVTLFVMPSITRTRLFTASGTNISPAVDTKRFIGTLNNAEVAGPPSPENPPELPPAIGITRPLEKL